MKIRPKPSFQLWHILVFIATSLLYIQTLYIIRLQANLDSQQREIDILRQNRSIHVKYEQKLEKYCSMSEKYGNSYKAVLEELISHLGLPPNSVVATFLEKYDSFNNLDFEYPPRSPNFKNNVENLKLGMGGGED